VFTTTSPDNKNNEFFQGVLERTAIAEKNWGNGYACGFNGMNETRVIKDQENPIDFGARVFRRSHY
jgi:hypothetical protein